MQYKARYTTPAAIEAAKKDFTNMVKNDTYYARYGGGGTCLSMSSSKGAWNEFFFLPGHGKIPEGELNDLVLSDSFFSGRSLGWTACSGNEIYYNFAEDGLSVIVEVKSYRHGIPSTTMKDFTPKEVLVYKTQEPSWKWWETLDDYRPRS